MAILVDYKCSSCQGVDTHWTASPPPASVECSACGGRSARRWAAIGLSGRAAEPAPKRSVRPSVPLCSKYPQVPGLCHMSESAGKVWLAKYMKDNRSLDRELAQQEAR